MGHKILLLLKIDQVIDRLILLHGKVREAMALLDALKAQVSANTTVIQSAVTLIAGLRQAIIDAGTDPAALQALTDSLNTSDTALAAALVANTPTPPAPTPVINLASIAVTHAAQNISVGGTLQMVATGTLNDGTSSDISASVAWKSDATSTATVSPTGLVTGVSAGSTVITATSGTFSGTVPVTVVVGAVSAARRP